MDASLPLQGPAAVDGALADRALGAARAAARADDAREAAREFEKLFASLLVKELRRGLSDGFFGAGPGADVFEGWLDQHVGAVMSEGEGLGLRIALERDLASNGTDGEESA